MAFLYFWTRFWDLSSKIETRVSSATRVFTSWELNSSMDFHCFAWTSFEGRENSLAFLLYMLEELETTLIGEDSAKLLTTATRFPGGLGVENRSSGRSARSLLRDAVRAASELRRGR